MQRTINLEHNTQVLLNAVMDLETLTSNVYSMIREEFAPEDNVNDDTGQDLLDASNGLRKVLDDYLVDRYRTACMQVSNQGNTLTI